MFGIGAHGIDEMQDFDRLCFVAEIFANSSVHAHFCGYLRDEAIPIKILWYEHWNYPDPKEHSSLI